VKISRQKQNRYKAGPKQPHGGKGKNKLILPNQRKTLLSWFGVLGTILTVFWGVYSFLPKVSLSPGDRLDPRNAMRGPFILKNEGCLPVYNIQIEYKDIDLLDAAGNRGDSFSASHIMGTEVKRLYSGESSFMDVEKMFKTNIPTIEARVTMRISYRPSLIFWRRSRIYSFEAKKTSSGEFNWYPIVD